MPASRATACPHCGDAAVSLFFKSRMGPFRNRDCRQCGGRIGIGWRAAIISSLVSLAAPVALIGVVMVLADANGQLFDGAFWEHYRVSILIGVAIGTSMVGGGLQVALQTLCAPLVKKPLKQ